MNIEKVIYTVITNDYDTLKEPRVITKGWDYLCFTDQDIKSDNWKIIKIAKTNDQHKEQRRKKIYNEYIFDTYKESIYIDGSITINTDLDWFVSSYVNSDFSLMKHPTRNCVYREADACIELNKDNIGVIFVQMKEYQMLGLPANVGMVATGVMYRKHTKKVKDFCYRWWQEVKEKSKRDQLSFNFVDWKTPINYTTFSFNVLAKEFLISKHK